MRRLFSAGLLLMLGVAHASSHSLHEIVEAMSTEISRAADSLVAPDGTRPYYVAARLEFNDIVLWRAERGELYPSQQLRQPALVAEVRVGSPELDDSRFEGVPSESFPFSVPIPLDGDPLLLRRILWSLFDDAFKQASRNLAEKKNWLESHPGARRNKRDFNPPLPHCDSDTIPEIEIDTLYWKNALQELSRITAKDSHLVEAPVVLQLQRTRRIIVDNLGSQIITDEQQGKIVAALLTQADDGAPLWDYWQQTATDLSEIDLEEAQRIISMRSARLDTLRHLSAEEEIYRGPLLFESEAAAQFLHNTLIPQLYSAEYELLLYEGAPPPIILSSLGRRLLPKGFALLDLPSLSQYQGNSSIGHYRFDHEGNRARDLTLIDDGMLVDLPSGLSALIPGKGSNGHFRHNAPSPSTTLFICPDNRIRSNLSATLLTSTREEGLSHSFIIQRFEDPSASVFFRSPLADDLRGRIFYSDADVIRPPVPVAMDRVDLSGKVTPVRPFQISSMGLSAYRHWIACSSRPQLHTVGRSTAAISPALLHGFLSLHPLSIQSRERPLFHDAQ